MGADKLAENTQMPQNLYAQAEVWDFDEKRLHWEFVVRALIDKRYFFKHLQYVQ